MFSMDSFISIEESHVDVLHEITVRLNAADEFHKVLDRVVEFASGLVKCDSCLVYVLEGDELVLRASKNPHPEVVDRLKLRVGQGITGWVAEHREPVAIPERAAQDPRFQFFHGLRLCWRTTRSGDCRCRELGWHAISDSAGTGKLSWDAK